MFTKRKDIKIARIDWVEDVYDLFKLKLIYYSGEFSVLFLENSGFFLRQI